MHGPEEPLFGISGASREKMSAAHNPLIMGGKLVMAFWSGMEGGDQMSKFGAKATWNCAGIRNLSAFVARTVQPLDSETTSRWTKRN
jgi:hypothetical protein